MCQWGPFPKLYIFFTCKMVSPTLIKGEERRGRDGVSAVLGGLDVHR